MRDNPSDTPPELFFFRKRLSSVRKIMLASCAISSGSILDSLETKLYLNCSGAKQMEICENQPETWRRRTSPWQISTKRLASKKVASCEKCEKFSTKREKFSEKREKLSTNLENIFLCRRISDKFLARLVSIKDVFQFLTIFLKLLELFECHSADPYMTAGRNFVRFTHS